MRVQVIKHTERIIALLEKQGWTQGVLVNDAGEMCVMGACWYSALATEPHIQGNVTAAWAMEFLYFLNKSGYEHTTIGNWNDDHARTQDEVFDRLRVFLHSLGQDAD